MGALLTEIGWALAGLGAAAVLLARRTVANRDEAVARILHELRGPVTAARLGLALGARGGELSAARVRAVDLELKRASLALQDLGEVRRGGAPGRPGSGWERHRPRGARRGSARRPASARRRASARRPASARRRDAEFDVVELLSDSVEVWRAVAVARGARLEFNWRGAPAAVRGERVRIAQATGNLIHNAIEHGGGLIEVRAHAGSDSVRVEVTDDGPGLPAPVADLARRPRAGRGLHGRGLAIACGIAEAHGGRIAAAPSRRGARLVLELPIAGHRAPASPLPDRGPLGA